jgi:hypothetical protein
VAHEIDKQKRHQGKHDGQNDMLVGDIEQVQDESCRSGQYAGDSISLVTQEAL